MWQGPAKTIDESGNPYVEQFIHGRAEGPIQMDVLGRRDWTCGTTPSPCPLPRWGEKVAPRKPLPVSERAM